MNESQLWTGPNGVNLPRSSDKPDEILPYATTLTGRQQHQIVAAFQLEAYDMAAEYAWKKAMVKLKETIGTLGMKFIGEMLSRPDLDDFTPIDVAITDHTAIELAEQLGVINKTAAIKLRHSNELINHYFSKEADEELDKTTAFGIVKSSIQYILGEQDISIALEFSTFRDRLLNETLRIDDPHVEQIINSPVFYLRTALTVLISAIKYENGAKLEHALSNLNLMLPHIWDSIGDNDKWNVGATYRDVTATGNSIAINGVKSALMKVGGFDFVPENLRSSTFVKAAKQLLEVHFAFNNFHNEPSAIKKLSNLGTTIPVPALIDCMQAYLAVYLGNSYGISRTAAPIAENELKKISRDRWLYYFERVIDKDEVVLRKMEAGQVSRFQRLLGEIGNLDFEGLPKDNQSLYSAITKNNWHKAYGISQTMLNKLRGS
ncbi:hypothetical protein [Sphingobacterium prati]|uniref:hypothetical protein n=1 Tax=Sphingobacterium prati TaxID=2737006 RepID=UPI0015582259|nr:hypothetical protein [Sphingobacterium prati]NPE46322.1 hypothetical protein [Sphingobacterium prati]